MSSSGSRSLPEHLAALLVGAAERLRSEKAAQRQRLESRERELTDLHAKVPPVADLQARAEEVAAALADRQRLLEELESTREEWLRRKGELAASFQSTRTQLRARCADLVAKLPLLDATGAAGWIKWLEEWHHHSGRPFEPAADWRESLSSRRILADALATVAPLVRQVHELEAITDEAGSVRSDLPAEITREEERIRELETSLAEHLQQIGPRYGRILEDLPDLSAGDTPARVEQIARLLANLETTLSRFASSALLERQMLEALWK